MERIQTETIPRDIRRKVHARYQIDIQHKKIDLKKEMHLGGEIIRSIGGARTGGTSLWHRRGQIFLTILSRFRGTGDVPAGLAKQLRRRRRPAKCQAGGNTNVGPRTTARSPVVVGELLYARV